MYCSIINIKSKLYFNYALPAGCDINLFYLLGGYCKKIYISSFKIIFIIKLMHQVGSIKNPFMYTSCKWENLGSMSSFSSCKVPFGICSVDNISDAFDNHKQLEEVGMSKQLQGAVKFWLYPVLLQLWHITELVAVKDFF